jgi:hypothetical protein
MRMSGSLSPKVTQSFGDGTDVDSPKAQLLYMLRQVGRRFSYGKVEVVLHGDSPDLLPHIGAGIEKYGPLVSLNV